MIVQRVPVSRYFSTSRKHDSKQEVADAIPQMMVQAIKHYQQVNGYLPERIVFYRDGVGEGQLQLVVDSEVQGILRVFKEESNYEPAFAFIVVSKRINTRSAFFVFIISGLPRARNGEQDAHLFLFLF